MEDSPSEMKKTAREREISDGKSSHTSFSSPSSLPEKIFGNTKEEDDANGLNNSNNNDAISSEQSRHYGPSQLGPTQDNNKDFPHDRKMLSRKCYLGNASIKTSTSEAAAAAVVAAAAASAKVGKDCISAVSSLTGSEISLSPRVNGSLWRGLQLQRQLEKQQHKQQQQKQQQMQQNTNQYCKEWKRPLTFQERDPNM